MISHEDVKAGDVFISRLYHLRLGNSEKLKVQYVVNVTSKPEILEGDGDEWSFSVFLRPVQGEGYHKIDHGHTTRWSLDGLMLRVGDVL